MRKRFIWSIIALLTIQPLFATGIDGLYTTLNPERGRGGQPTQKVFMQKTELQGQPVIAVVGCNPGCVPVVYSPLEEPSQTLGRSVYFSRAGIYLIQFDENQWVTAMPDAELGKAEWKMLRFHNVYTKEGQSNTVSLEQAKQFALNQSKKIMNTGNLTAMTHEGANYYAAVPVNSIGKKHEKITITRNESDAKLEIKPCDKCPTDSYQYLTDESSITGRPTYANNLGQLIFDVADGVFIWAKMNGDFGKKEWSKNHYFNVYASDIGYIRGVRSDKQKQDAVDNLLKDYAKQVKAEMDQRRAKAEQKQITEQRLPAKGMSDSQLEQEVTEAAKRWAGRYRWKETIPYAYLTGTDWSILHHPLTGLVTGRTIYGIIVMKRDDGLCSFHYAQFGQDYNGSDFSNTHMVGLTPGQIKLECQHI